MNSNNNFIIQCNLIRLAGLTFLIIEVAAVLLAWLLPGPLHVWTAAMEFTTPGITPELIRAMSPGQRFVGMLVELPALILLGYALFRLNLMLNAIKYGAYFIASNIEHLRAFSGAIVLSTASAIMATPLRQLLFNLMNPSTGCHFSVAFSGDNLWILVICSVFYAIARLMCEGQRIAEENAGFV